MSSMVEACCFGTIIVLTIISSFIDVPIHVNITLFSLSIIIAGAWRSVDQLLIEFKKIHVDKKESKEGEGVETMSKEEVQ